MAIEKLIEFPNGTSVSYHKITDFTLPDRDPSTFVLNMYMNDTIRQQGAERFVTKITCSLSPTQQEELRDLVLPVLYGYLKTLPEFVDAIDC